MENGEYHWLLDRRQPNNYQTTLAIRKTFKTVTETDLSNFTP